MEPATRWFHLSFTPICLMIDLHIRTATIKQMKMKPAKTISQQISLQQADPRGTISSWSHAFSWLGNKLYYIVGTGIYAWRYVMPAHVDTVALLCTKVQ